MRILLVFIYTVFVMFGLFSSSGEASDVLPPNTKQAMFAGGCFWCMEPPYERLEGVYDVLSGYAGGHIDNPSYKEVSRGDTGHKEVVQVTYDPDVINYETLLDIFWRNIDPFDPQGQFCDKGNQYSSAIFTSDEDEKALAEQSKKAMEKRLGHKIVTEILPTATFYKAEHYHQDYYLNNKYRYKFYRGRCGRDKRLEEIWGKEAGGYNFGTERQ